MAVTKVMNSKANTKQYSQADLPFNPKQPVIARMAPVESTLNQTVINLPFMVDVANAQDSFFLSIDGKILSIGSNYDYLMTNIDALGFSNQVTLNNSIDAGLNIQAWKLGLKKESEFAQDQRFVNTYAYMESGFQNFVDQSVRMTPTTNTGAPAAGTFYSSIINRADLPDLRQNLKSMIGCERIMTHQKYEIQGEHGPNGEISQGIVGDTKGQIRLMGLWFDNYDNNGAGQSSADANAYAEVTFYGTGLNLVMYTDGANRNFKYSVDGAAYVNGTYPTSGGSYVLAARGYAQNTVFPVISNLPLGVHTIRLAQVAGTGFFFTGFEILNNAALVKTNPGAGMSQGRRVVSVTQDSVAPTLGVTGTRGGRMITYLDSDGSVGRSFQPVNVSAAYGVSADHSNEEKVRQYHFREFGSTRADDFYTLDSSPRDASFTLDDGSTILTGKNVRVNSGEVLNPGAPTTDFVSITFVGTGLDVVRQDDGNSGTNHSYDIIVDGATVGSYSNPASTSPRIEKLVSGLPYGTHTVRLLNTASPVQNVAWKEWIVYGPKKPSIPSGAVEIADYGVMADFVANVSSTSEAISTGVLRKNVSVREGYYFDGSTPWTITQGIGYAGGHTNNSAGAGGYFEYTFFGTGCDLRFDVETNNSNAINVTLNGLAANTTNYPSMSSSAQGGAGFTPSTGVLNQNNSSAAAGGLALYNLPLAVYTIRLTNTTADIIRISTLDIITPIHGAELPTAEFQNNLSLNYSGPRDSRNLTPIKAQPKKQKKVSRALGVRLNPATSVSVMVPMPDMSVIANSDGGWFDVNFVGTLYRSGGSANNIILQIYVDGIGLENISYYGPAITADVYLYSIFEKIYLSPGAHKIDLYWQAGGGATWTAYDIRRKLTVSEA